MSKFKLNSDDREFMEIAIREQGKCEYTPKVGAVIVTSSNEVITGFRHEIDKLHAEAVVLKKLRERNINAAGCVLYVTMEPCNELAKNCAQAIIDAGIKEVVIGSYDLNPDVNRLGWMKMRDCGIVLRDFDSDLIDASRKLNPVEHFHKKIGPHGHGRFAYKQNGNKGVFDLQFSDSDDRTISFGCSSRDQRSIYIYGKKNAGCAEARKANEFSEIDNPDAYQYDYAATAEIGSITIIRSPDGCALLRVKDVDHANNTIKFDFEIRPLERDC
jgi:diaminohydroxyphosphoribosylaminopyrimidine deaminase / 5-amino-6-(5-phosphoribosylamino)uracil reductase